MKDGLILIDKPAGITSFVAVAIVRRALGVKHCGHTGTLDPMAEGLLPILTGKATKLSAFLLEGDKSYIASLKFGESTDTYDSTGAVLQSGGRIPTEEELLAVLPEFTGKHLSPQIIETDEVCERLWAELMQTRYDTMRASGHLYLLIGHALPRMTLSDGNVRRELLEKVKEQLAKLPQA